MQCLPFCELKHASHGLYAIAELLVLIRSNSTLLKILSSLVLKPCIIGTPILIPWNSKTMLGLLIINCIHGKTPLSMFENLQNIASCAHKKTVSRDIPDLISPLQYNGLKTALLSSRRTMQSGASCRSVSSTRESLTRMSDSWRNGPDLTTRHQCCSYLLNGKLVCVRVWRTFWTLFFDFTDEW